MYNVWLKWWSSHPIPQFFYMFTCKTGCRGAASIKYICIYETTLFFTQKTAAAGSVYMLSVGRLLYVAETDKE